MTFEKGHEFYPGGEKGWFEEGQEPFNKNKKLSDWMSIQSNEIRKKKISKKLKELYASGKRKCPWKGKRGEGTPRFKNGIRAYRRYINIKKCTECNSNEKLQVHHIDHNRTNNRITNLKVLCSQCHTEHHWRNHSIQYSGNCELCRMVFNSKIHNKRFCSIECQQKSYRMKKRGE